MDRPCSQCGGKLAGVPFERTVVCSYCQTAQPNLDCVSVGQELIFQDGRWPTLDTVVACRGPDEIELKGAKTMKLEDVTPVMRPPETLGAFTLVFCQTGFGWERSWTAAAAKHGSVKVKHAGPGFQDDFFSRELSLSAVRIPARANEQQVRSKSEMLREQMKADPIGTAMNLIFKVIHTGMMLAFVVFFLVLFIYALVGNL